MNTTERPVVLFVDDEAGNLTAFNAAFRMDFDVRLAQGAHEAMQALNQERIDVMITDQRMPSMTGINLVRKTKETHPEVVKMLLTGFADHDVVLAALNEGLVYRFFEKPWVPSMIVREVHGAHALLKAFRQRKGQLLEMRDNLQRGVDSVDELLGHLSIQQDELGLGLAQELKAILGGS